MAAVLGAKTSAEIAAKAKPHTQAKAKEAEANKKEAEERATSDGKGGDEAGGQPNVEEIEVGGQVAEGKGKVTEGNAEGKGNGAQLASADQDEGDNFLAGPPIAVKGKGGGARRGSKGGHRHGGRGGRAGIPAGGPPPSCAPTEPMLPKCLTCSFCKLVVDVQASGVTTKKDAGGVVASAFHNRCRAGDDQINRTAIKLDAEESDIKKKVHKKHLDWMKKNKPVEYHQLLFKMVLEQDEGVKSRAEKQAVAASVLEDLVNFTKVYSEMEIVMRHEWAFIKFLVEDGQVRDEAEGKAAWDRAAHPSSGVKREIDALGRLTLAVPGLKRYVGQSGTGRNTTISNAMNLQSVDDMNHAQRLMQGQTDIADSVFTRAAGGAFRASASYAHMPTPIGDGGGGPIEAMSPEHLLPFILTGAGGAAEDLKRPIPAPAGGESLPAGPPTTKQGQEDAGPQPPQPAQPKVMNVQEFMEAKKDMAACLRRNYVPVIGTDGKSGGMEVAQKLIAEITDLGDEALEEVKQLGAPTFFDTHKALATELRQIDVNGVPKCKMQEWDAMWENLTVKLAEFQESECQFASFVEALKLYL